MDFVTVFGGDGGFHSVPVHWVEYIPVSKQSVVRLKQINVSEKEFNCGRIKANDDESLSANARLYGFYRRILCCLLNDDGKSK